MTAWLRRHPLAASPGDPRRAELVLARARLSLTACSLIAITVDPAEPARYARLAYALLAGYVVYSGLVVLGLSREAEVSRRVGIGIHLLDVLWAAVLSLFTEGPSSPFFIFFSFVLLAAAYRWGTRGTSLTAPLAALLLLVQLLPVLVPAFPIPIEVEVEVNRLLMRIVYLFILAWLLGYLADAGSRLRTESSATASLLAQVQGSPTLRRALEAFCTRLQALFGARATRLLVRESASGRAFLWEADRDGLVAQEVPPDDEPRRSFLPSGEAWLLSRASGAWRVSLALDPGGNRLGEPREPPPGAVVGGASALATAVPLADDTTAHVLLLDPAPAATGEDDLRFLQRLVREAAPALQNAELLRRLRSRAGAMERARVARELHDGVIQSLIGLEMQVSALRRRVDGGAPGVSEELPGALGRIQGLLRAEVQSVRELMQQMRPVEVAPTELLDHLARLVERFSADTGIAARFVTGLPEVRLPPKACRETVRIVQESLANVRRHAAASHVLVRLDRSSEGWGLVIDDDGRGFDFDGRLTLEDLDRQRRGPLVIKERVRGMGGSLTLESRPGQGSRLEIRLPTRPHA